MMALPTCERHPWRGQRRKSIAKQRRLFVSHRPLMRKLCAAICTSSASVATCLTSALVSSIRDQPFFGGHLPPMPFGSDHERGYCL
jgi:hypothetical protein